MVVRGDRSIFIWPQAKFSVTGRLATGYLAGCFAGSLAAAFVGFAPGAIAQPSKAPPGNKPAPANPAPNSASSNAVPSNAKILALAEALRRKIGEGPGLTAEPYYGAWQVKGSSIPAWSKSCLGRSITPGQFADSPETARSVVLCVLKDEFQKALTQAKGNETIAVQQVAAWWRTGDAERYRDGAIAPFTQQVVKLYQQQLAATPAGESPLIVPTKDTLYDRYMSTGYQFSRASEYGQAVLYFKRALDERPKDSFAANALRDNSRKAKAGQHQETTEPSVALTSQYWTEVAKNDAGDRTLVAPSSLTRNEAGVTVAYWEYRAFRGANPAFFPLPKPQPVKSALLYRVTDCAAKTTQTRVMKLYTDPRKEIHQENFGSAGLLETPAVGSSGAKAIAYACERVGNGANEADEALVEPVKSP